MFQRPFHLVCMSQGCPWLFVPRYDLPSIQTMSSDVSMPPDCDGSLGDDDPCASFAASVGVSLPVSVHPDEDAQGEDHRASDIELPPVVEEDHSESDGSINGFDIEVNADFEEDCAVAADPDVCVAVPGPTTEVSGVHDIAEIFSPPRTVPEARKRGLRGNLSLDLLSGWDFRAPAQCAKCLFLLGQLDVLFAIVCPPCTMFSPLQLLWNYKRMDPEVWRLRLREAVMYVDHAMECCKEQVRRGRFFLFEHPQRSSAFELGSVTEVLALPGVRRVSFDQCMFGLKSKVRGVPMRKRTTFLTNAKPIVNAFSGRFCDCSHDHQIIEGAEGGMKRAAWAQMYPPPMVHCIVEAACQMTR